MLLFSAIEHTWFLSPWNCFDIFTVIRIFRQKAAPTSEFQHLHQSCIAVQIYTALIFMFQPLKNKRKFAAKKISRTIIGWNKKVLYHLLFGLVLNKCSLKIVCQQFNRSLQMGEIFTLNQIEVSSLQGKGRGSNVFPNNYTPIPYLWREVFIKVLRYVIYTGLQILFILLQV